MLGLPVNFGFTGTDGIAATEFTGKIILQSTEYSTESDEEQVRSAVGAVAVRNFYNASYKATLEYIPTAATVANTYANTTLPAIGSIISITACASAPYLIATNWVVVPGGKISQSNTGAAKISLALEKHAGITAAAS